jgi:hypothetical protein
VRRGATGNGLLAVSLAGSEQLEDVAGRLRAAGRKDLQDELDSELRKPPRRLQSAVAANVAPTMPKGYEVPLGTSLKWKTRIRTRGPSGAGVRVTVSSRRHLRALDEGRLRHPVFGRMDSPWVVQRIRSGFFSDPAEREIRRVQDETVAAIDRVAAKIGGVA